MSPCRTWAGDGASLPQPSAPTQGWLLTNTGWLHQLVHPVSLKNSSKPTILFEGLLNPFPSPRFMPGPISGTGTRQRMARGHCQPHLCRAGSEDAAPYPVPGQLGSHRSLFFFPGCG